MSRRSRARASSSGLAWVGLALAVGVVAAGIALGGSPAQAATRPAAPGPIVQAAPTGTTVATGGSRGRSLKIAVSPYQGLSPAGAQITVVGRGFNPSHDLWVAVCQDDGVAPAALLHCVGGAIPDDNATTGWGVVTRADHPPFPGPVTTSWQRGGAFELTLQLPDAISESADCVSAPCSVYTRSSDNADRAEDLAVGVSFTTPPGSSSSPSSGAESTGPTAPSTETIGGATTVTPASMLQTSVAAGGAQTVVFGGFTPGEQVNVTLYSDPVTLPPVTADPAGNVRISFDVPADLPAGEHILQAIGTQSGRVGIARFFVGAAASSVSASASGSASATISTTPSATQSLASSVATGGAVASNSATAPASSVTGASTVATSSAAAGGTGHRLLWLWIALAILVVLGGAAAVVVMVRGRREHDDQPPVAPAVVPPSHPGWSAGTTTRVAAPPTNLGGGFGLLSGRDHPDGPALYSGGAWHEPPTRFLGPPVPPGGPATEQWRPDFGGGQPPAGPGVGPGPATEQWRPDFAGQQPPAPDDEDPAGRHRPQ